MPRLGRLLRSLYLAFALVSCGDKDEPTAAKPAVPDEPAPDPEPVADAQAPTDAEPAAAPTGPDPVGEYDAQAKLLFRVAACGGTAELPARIPAKLVETHCAAFEKIVTEYKTKWLDKAVPFLATVVPPGLPDRVIYPFGGSDLITALATFPDAREITIISLEKSGDVRAIDRLKAEDLGTSLKENRDHLTFLLRSAFHKTVDLKAMSENGLPGELVDDMVALRVHGLEPVSLRYYKLADDGTIEYTPKSFTNVELTFRKPGGPLRTYRHVSADLSNGGLKKNVALMAYLKARAPFAAMTKASSFLLWESYFSTIRDFLLENMVFMISDATAPLPKDAQKAGFEQIPYGVFEGAEPAFENLDASAMVELWKKSEKRESPIRYGYSDIKRRPHLLITRKKAAP